MAARKRAKTRYALPELGQSASKRPARVAETIREHLAVLLQRKIRDPRVVGVTLTGVDMTPDLRTAIIYFSCADGEEDTVQNGLESAQGFLRSSLAKVLALRYMPKLVFKHDLSISHQDEMNRILREIKNERESTQQDS